MMYFEMVKGASLLSYKICSLNKNVIFGEWAIKQSTLSLVLLQFLLSYVFLLNFFLAKNKIGRKWKIHASARKICFARVTPCFLNKYMFLQYTHQTLAKGEMCLGMKNDVVLLIPEVQSHSDNEWLK